MSKDIVKIKLVKSLIGQQKKVKASILGLGLRKLGSEVELPKTKETLGLINKVIHLVEIKG